MKPLELFKAEDFESEHIDAFNYTQVATDIANAKLNDWLKSAVRVYAYKPLGKPQQGWHHYDDGIPDKYDTHQALLVCVEEMPKDKCEHEPSESKDVFGNYNTRCKKCGVKLTPVAWKEE